MDLKVEIIYQATSSDIGFAAFGVTGRAVIDFALLTSQVSGEKICTLLYYYT